MNLLKNKKILYTLAILALLVILKFCFKSKLFNELFAIIVITLGFCFLCILISSEWGKILVGIIIGGAIALCILYQLLGEAVIPIGIIAIAVLVGMRLKRKAEIKKKNNEINQRNNEIEKDREARLKALEKLIESGYYTKILNKRLEAFNANPATIQNVEVNWNATTPQEKWLTLEQQYEFFKENAQRMNDLGLNNEKRDYFSLLGNISKNKQCLDDFQTKEFRCINPIKNLYENYQFDYKNTEKGIYSNLKQYKTLFDKEREAFFSQFSRIKSGVEGEKRVNEELALFKDVIENLQNIRLEIEGTSVESDNILITENGIFSVEVKNFGENGQYSIVIAKDGQWLKEYENGTREPMKNVTTQLNRHIGLKQRFLNDELKKKINEADLPYVNIYPLIVIANDKVMITNNSDLPVIRASSIYHYVMNYNGIKLDRKYWPAIKEIFKTHSLKPKAYPVSINFEGLELVHTQIWEQLKAYYVFSSMIDTFGDDLIHAGITSNNKDEPFKDIDVSNTLPREISSYIHLQYKSESELRG